MRSNNYVFNRFQCRWTCAKSVFLEIQSTFFILYRGKFVGENSSGKILIGENFRHQAKLSSLFPDEFFPDEFFPDEFFPEEKFLKIEIYIYIFCVSLGKSFVREIYYQLHPNHCVVLLTNGSNILNSEMPTLSSNRFLCLSFITSTHAHTHAHTHTHTHTRTHIQHTYNTHTTHIQHTYNTQTHTHTHTHTHSQKTENSFHLIEKCVGKCRIGKIPYR